MYHWEEIIIKIKHDFKRTVKHRKSLKCNTPKKEPIYFLSQTFSNFSVPWKMASLFSIQNLIGLLLGSQCCRTLQCYPGSPATQKTLPSSVITPTTCIFVVIFIFLFTGMSCSLGNVSSVSGPITERVFKRLMNKISKVILFIRKCENSLHPHNDSCY